MYINAIVHVNISRGPMVGVSSRACKGDGCALIKFDAEPWGKCRTHNDQQDFKYV